MPGGAAGLPYRLGDSSPPINATSSTGLAATNSNGSPATPPSSTASQQPQTPSSNPLHPHPYHHPHHHPHHPHHPPPPPPHPYQLHHAHLAAAAAASMENHSPPIPGLAQHLPIRPQPQHLPNPQGAALPPLHLHHPGLMGAHPAHLPPTSNSTGASSPVLSPLRIRVNSPSRINSELLDKSVSSTTPTSTATVRDEECSPPGIHSHHHHHNHNHHHHRNTNSSSPITTSVVGVKITASSGGQTTVPTLHRPFSPSPKLKNVS